MLYRGLISRGFGCFGSGSIILVSGLTLWLGGWQQAGAEGVVSDLTEASLRSALSGGGLVTFGVSGTISLSNTVRIANDTVLDGTGQPGLMISGGGQVGVLRVNPGVVLTVRNLGVVEGKSQRGGGILNEGGTLNLSGVLLANNLAKGSDGENGVDGVSGSTGFGGAIYNLGTLLVSNCVFVGNGAVGGSGGDGDSKATGGTGGDGASGFGGGIFNAGPAMVSDSTFDGNEARGGAGGAGGDGERVSNPRNSGFAGGPGGDGASGEGGAIFHLTNDLSMAGCTLMNNRARGGSGGLGGDGSSSPIGAGFAGGRAGSGGLGLGGGVLGILGGVSMTNCTVALNEAVGGAGGAGGTGADCRDGRGNGGAGGASGNGGDALGGGVLVEDAMAHLVFTTLATNQVMGGVAGIGGSRGKACVGGFDGLKGSSGLTGTNFAGGVGILSGGAAGQVRLASTILAHGEFGSNCFGAVLDGGNNISTDASCGFSATVALGEGRGPSLNETDPMLGPLADNGGNTLTMAVFMGSPAIDAGGGDCPSTDQRGVARPFGAACDVGAYEFCLRPTIATAEGNRVSVQFPGVPGRAYRIEASSDLDGWVDLGVKQAGSGGMIVFEVAEPISASQRFYRAVSF